MADSTSPGSAMMTAAGSFAAISTLFGSPLLGAFLIMETAGIGGVAVSMVVLPGLLASGIGALVFVGLGNWTGLGTFSLALQSVDIACCPAAGPRRGDGDTAGSRRGGDGLHHHQSAP